MGVDETERPTCESRKKHDEEVQAVHGDSGRALILIHAIRDFRDFIESPLGATRIVTDDPRRGRTQAVSHAVNLQVLSLDERMIHALLHKESDERLLARLE
jgi:hypothetical protein